MENSTATKRARERKGGESEGKMAEVRQIRADEFEAEVLQSEVPVVVDFRASWCYPCRILEPVMEEIAREYEGKVKVIKVDVDDEGAADLANKFGVLSVPTLLFVKGGEVVDRIVGAVPKRQIERALKRLL